MSLTSRGQTAKHGVTAISSLIPVEQFYTENIQPELADPNVNDMPILKSVWHYTVPSLPYTLL